MYEPVVYFIRCVSDIKRSRYPKTGLIKIGQTWNFSDRMTNIRCTYGEMEILGTIPGDEDTEEAIHRLFAEYQFQPYRGKLNFYFRDWFHDVQEIRNFIAINRTDMSKPHRLYLDKEEA